MLRFWAEGKTGLKKVLLKASFFWNRESKHPSLKTETLCHSGAAPAPGDTLQTCSRCISPQPFLEFRHQTWTKTGFQINIPASDHVVLLLSQQRMSRWGHKSSTEPPANPPPALFCSFLSTGNTNHTKRRIHRWSARAVEHKADEGPLCSQAHYPNRHIKQRKPLKISYVSYLMLCSTVFPSIISHVLLICTGQGKYSRDVSSLNYHVF